MCIRVELVYLGSLDSSILYKPCQSILSNIDEIKITCKQEDRAFISGSNILAGFGGSGGGGMALAASSSFKREVGIDAEFCLRMGRGLGGIFARSYGQVTVLDEEKGNHNHKLQHIVT